MNFSLTRSFLTRRRLSLLFGIVLVTQLLPAPLANALTEDDSVCAEEKNTYANCVFRMEPPSKGKACDQCRIATYQDLNDDTGCESLETDMCQAVNSCGCDECQDELEQFWRCTTETASNFTCSIDCFTESSPTADGPLCPAQFDSYKTCVLEELPEAQVSACDDCRLQASNRIPSNVQDCTVVQDIFCHAIQTCDCGNCRAPLQDYLDCDVSKRWFGECNVDCSGYNSNNDGSSTIDQSLGAESGAVKGNVVMGLVATSLGLAAYGC